MVFTKWERNIFIIKFACIYSSRLEALPFPFSTMFLRSSDLRLTTASAIATYTQLGSGFYCSSRLISVLISSITSGFIITFFPFILEENM